MTNFSVKHRMSFFGRMVGFRFRAGARRNRLCPAENRRLHSQSPATQLAGLCDPARVFSPVGIFRSGASFAHRSPVFCAPAAHRIPPTRTLITPRTENRGWPSWADASPLSALLKVNGTPSSRRTIVVSIDRRWSLVQDLYALKGLATASVPEDPFEFGASRRTFNGATASSCSLRSATTAAGPYHLSGSTT